MRRVRRVRRSRGSVPFWVRSVGGGDRQLASKETVRWTTHRWQTVAVAGQMDLRSLLAAVGRIRSGQRPPLVARMLTESIAHRHQSSSSQLPSASRITWWSRARTRSRLHWAKRQYTARQHGPNSGGSCHQVQPDVATNTIAANVSRSPARRRPPPCGRRMTVTGTTRLNSSHCSSLVQGRRACGQNQCRQCGERSARKSASARVAAPGR